MGFVNTSLKALVGDATNLSPEEAELEPRSAVSEKRQETSPGSDEGYASDSVSEGSQENKVGVSINLTRDFVADKVGSMGAFDGRDIDLSDLVEGRFDDSEIRGASCLLKMRETGREVNVLVSGSTENSGEEKSADVMSIGGDVLAQEERYECLPGNEEEVDDTTMNINAALKETSEINDNEEEDDLDEGLEFSVGDFVWGKIKSHPWWPGQIFDPSDASEYALKLKQRKRLLVAYFGDGTFAWCHPSQLKPFEENFEEMSRQSNLKSFHNAVEEAIDEIGRIMEWKMICSCIPKEHCDGLDQRYVLNAGIKEGVLLHDSQILKAGVLPEPTEILDEVKGIACGTSINSFLRMKKLTSHLSALYRSRGGLHLPIYQEPLMIVGLEDTSDSNARDLWKFNAQGPFEEEWLSSPLSLKFSQPNKPMLQNCESTSENWGYQRRKKKSMAEIMDSDYSRTAKGSSEDKSLCSTKRSKSSVTDNLEKEADSQKEAASKERYRESGQSDEEQIDKSFMSRERKNSKYLSPPFTSLNKVKTRIDTEEESLNISERMAKAASNIARSSPILRLNDEMFQENFLEDLDPDHKRLENLGQQKLEQNENVTIDQLKVNASSDKVLSEVRSVALNPLYPLQSKCLETVEDFMPFFRSSIYRNGSCYKLYNKRLSGGKRKNPNLEQGSLCKDQYQRVVGPLSEENKVRKSKKVKLDEAEQEAGSKAAKSAKSKLKTPKSKMNDKAHEEDDSPGLLFVTFDPGSSLPSKDDLLKIYSKFGSLDEAETEMNHQNLCAKVVFLRISDGEEAFNSSQKVNPFGQSKATFRLRYSLPPSKTQARSKQSHLEPSPSAEQSSEGMSFQSQLQFIKQELEKLTSMVENSDGEVSPEMSLKLQGEMKGLLDEVSRMVSHSLVDA